MIGAIIQARMGSTRLPGKVMMPLQGKPMLLYMIDRVKRSKLVEKIVVATTCHSSDDIVVRLCEENNVHFSRGPISDVAYRYVSAAYDHDIETIVRLTADCPFIDPDVIDRCIEVFDQTQVTYVANTAPPETRTFPDGSDVEVFYALTLESLLMHKYITGSDREHVTHGFWKNDVTKHLFRTAQLKAACDRSQYRYTVDYAEDYAVAHHIAQELDRLNICGSVIEICDILDAHPDMMSLNADHKFGEGWLKK